MPAPRQTILVVEDEQSIADAIVYALQTEGFIPLWKTTLGEARRALAEDEITLVKDRLHLTLGTKVERNDYTGLELQTSVRLSWEPSLTQTVWGAVSHAVRTPGTPGTATCPGPASGAATAPAARPPATSPRTARARGRCRRRPRRRGESRP